MRSKTEGDHYQVVFESFSEYLDYHIAKGAKANFSADWNGAAGVPEAVAIAREGLHAAGVKALEMATEILPALDADLIDQRFKPMPAVEGADVDIAVFLSGEPECMLTYELDQTVSVEPIVTIVVATGVLGMVSGKAIEERGARVMAMLQAIEYTGVQTEIWSDSTTKGGSGREMTGRISVRLKAAGEPFDASTLMYCMTHSSMHRVLGFNTKDHFPSRWAAAMNKRRGYGSTALGDMIHPGDYPENTVYIRALRNDSDVLNVEDTLRELGLMA